MIAVSGSRYGVDGTSAETSADVERFARGMGLAYPTAYDPQLDVVHHYRIHAFPAILVIDRHKVVAFEAAGEVPEHVIETAVADTLR